MSNKIFLTFLLISMVVKGAFAYQLEFNSTQHNKSGLNNTYTMKVIGEGKEKSTDNKLVIEKINRSRTPSFRKEAFIYEGWDKVMVNGKTFTVHFVSMTEKNGMAHGVWKAYDSNEKLVDKGTYVFKADRPIAKIGTL